MKPNHYESSHSFQPQTELLRRYALLLLTGCADGSATLLREQIRLAPTSADLVRMRSGIFECMLRGVGEAEAMDRIRSFDLTAA